MENGFASGIYEHVSCFALLCSAFLWLFRFLLLTLFGEIVFVMVYFLSLFYANQR